LTTKLILEETPMTNQEILLDFYTQVLQSIENKTFAKLTFAKTIGNTNLMNIYVRAILVDEKIKLELTYKFQKEEQVEIHTTENAFDVLSNYIGNPFLSLLLFTTQKDISLKINKKRDYKIIEQEPTFKNSSPVFLQ
jgi:hypothetical protein